MLSNGLLITFLSPSSSLFMVPVYTEHLEKAKLNWTPGELCQFFR